ncbi:hypothetical protein [Nonomuraea sp. bgisy101]|uniref:hypothetical protein n=1 Tax=Nonomuraea sp. bgisy101 TaxID=3413784 RepID=UPI003D7456DD
MRIALVLAGVAVAGALTSQPAVAESTSIPKNFLQYEKEARKDVKHKHWYVNEGENRDLIEVENLQCDDSKLRGWIDRRDVSYDPEIGGGERTDSKWGEQVFLFADAGRAGRMLRQMRERMEGCDGITITQPVIGDGAITGSRTVGPTKSQPIAQTQKFVAVRKGAAVALYWDLHNQAKAQRTMAQHLADAKRMAAKLCDLGGC